MTERARKLDASRLRVLPGGSPTPAPSYRLLTQVSAALSTSLDLDRTLKEILERMNALVAFDAATNHDPSFRSRRRWASPWR